MRIIVSATANNIDSQLDSRFGRCPYFIIAEIEDKKITKIEAFENLSAEKAGGAGISAAQQAAEKKAEAVITGNIGPRASDVLKQFSIKVYSGSGTVKEALQAFVDGKLELLGGK